MVVIIFFSERSIFMIYVTVNILASLNLRKFSTHVKLQFSEF